MRDVKSNFATEQSNSDAEKGCVAAKRRLADLALGVLIVWCVRGECARLVTQSVARFG